MVVIELELIIKKNHSMRQMRLFYNLVLATTLLLSALGPQWLLVFCSWILYSTWVVISASHYIWISLEWLWKLMLTLRELGTFSCSYYTIHCSPSWKDDSHLAGWEISCFLWDPVIYYCVLKNLPLDCILWHSCHTSWFWKEENWKKYYFHY